MKIRIKDSSIRFRLTQSEVTEFERTGKISAHTDFNGSQFGYALQVNSSCTTLEADFTNQVITIFVPEDLARRWTGTSQVGIEDIQKLDDGNQLLLLIEKDFMCLDDRDEDESDNYPNPKSGSIHE